MDSNVTVSTTVRVEIKSWLDGRVLFSAEVSAELSTSARLVAALVKANLSRADLSGANLYGANLSRADLSGADLSGADHAVSLGSPDGWHLVIVKHEDGIRIAAGCRWFTWEAAVAHWADHPDDRRATRAALEYAKALVVIKGWKL